MKVSDPGFKFLDLLKVEPYFKGVSLNTGQSQAIKMPDVSYLQYINEIK
jgi:hypothetical protein